MSKIKYRKDIRGAYLLIRFTFYSHNTMLSIRNATPDDAAAILNIYAPYVTETAITFELEVPSVEEFRSRITETISKFPYLVAIEGEKIVGYCYAGTFRKRPAYNHCVEMSIYIDKDFRGKGIGRILYAEIERRLKEQGILNLNASITTTTFPDNHLTPDSEFFHASLGYSKVAHFHMCGHKFNRWYDMIWMEKMIGEHKVTKN